jgi:hypothetical protein
MKPVTINSFNNTKKDVQWLNLIHDCCWMAADELLLDEQQLENRIKSKQNHDENLHLGTHKDVNVRNIFDKEKLKFKHSAGKHMPLLPITGVTF